MICDFCIHKEVCYEKEEDRQALKYCSDYFNFVEELEKIKKIKKEIDESSFEIYEKYSEEPIVCNYTINVMQIIDKYIAELKGE